MRAALMFRYIHLRIVVDRARTAPRSSISSGAAERRRRAFLAIQIFKNRESRSERCDGGIGESRRKKRGSILEERETVSLRRKPRFSGREISTLSISTDSLDRGNFSNGRLRFAERRRRRFLSLSFRVRKCRGRFAYIDARNRFLVLPPVSSSRSAKRSGGALAQKRGSREIGAMYLWHFARPLIISRTKNAPDDLRNGIREYRVGVADRCGMRCDFNAGGRMGRGDARLA